MGAIESFRVELGRAAAERGILGPNLLLKYQWNKVKKLEVEGWETN